MSYCSSYLSSTLSRNFFIWLYQPISLRHFILSSHRASVANFERFSFCAKFLMYVLISFCSHGLMFHNEVSESLVLSHFSMSDKTSLICEIHQIWLTHSILSSPQLSVVNFEMLFFWFVSLKYWTFNLLKHSVLSMDFLYIKYTWIIILTKAEKCKKLTWFFTSYV